MDDADGGANVPTPIDAVEMAHAMAGMAAVWMSLFRSFIEEGASEIVAMQLTAAYIHGTAGGRLS